MQKSHGVDPSTLAALHPGRGWDLRFKKYRTSVRTQGSHHMALRQPSRTPESSREFSPGDPVGLIDWKAFARTDQLIVREVRDEASARVSVVLDLSETMAWPDATVPTPRGRSLPVPKAEVAFRVACDLAHAHLTMGDLVAIWVLVDGSEPAPQLRLLPRSPSDLIATFNHVDGHGFGAATMRQGFHPFDFDTQSSWDVTWWVGDGLGQGDWRRFLARGKSGGLLQVLSSMELDIDWVDEETSYFDEGRTRREYQGQVLKSREGYKSSLEIWRRRTEKAVRKLGLSFLTVTDRTPIAAYRSYLAQMASPQVGEVRAGHGSR